MLQDLLNENTVEVNVNAKDWKEAILIGGELLEKEQKIEHEYIDAMIKTVKDIGPYIVIAPGIAMPHARPEFGSKDIGMALITLKNPIKFGNDEYDPVNMLILFCAKDNSSHIKLLSEFMQLIEDESFLKLAKNTDNKKEILDYIRNKSYK